MTAPDRPPVQPHDDLAQLLPDLWFTRGSIEFVPGGRVGRNMVVLREGAELTLIASVRLSEAQERELESLGMVRRVERICAAHGCDDAYTVDRFGAEFWCLEGADSDHAAPKPDHQFRPGESLPFCGLRSFGFEGVATTEAALLWPRHGGVLITGDAFQHYSGWRQFNGWGRAVCRVLGFRRGTIVGPVWHGVLTQDEAALRRSFDTLLEEDFEHAIALHGDFVEGDAHEAARRAVEQEFADSAMPSWLAARFRRQLGL